MNENFDASFDLVMKHEGGFVNNPKDPGGMTNLGVTRKAWEDYVGHAVDELTMRSLDIKQVKPFYKKRYWDVIKGDELQIGLDYCCFDLAVNSGTGRAAKFLQLAAGISADGAIGPLTMIAVNRHPAEELIIKVCEERINFLQSLNTFTTFGKGWSRRVTEVRDKALEMSNGNG
jgi:lysozyme family protein